MPDFNTSIVTTAVAGSTLDVSWCGTHHPMGLFHSATAARRNSSVGSTFYVCSFSRQGRQDTLLRILVTPGELARPPRPRLTALFASHQHAVRFLPRAHLPRLYTSQHFPGAAYAWSMISNAAVVTKTFMLLFSTLRICMPAGTCTMHTTEASAWSSTMLN